MATKRLNCIQNVHWLVRNVLGMKRPVILDRDSHWYSRRVIQIRLHPLNINRDRGLKMPYAWMNTIWKHKECTNHRVGRSANLGTVRSTNHGTDH